MVSQLAADQRPATVGRMAALRYFVNRDIEPAIGEWAAARGVTVRTVYRWGRDAAALVWGRLVAERQVAPGARGDGRGS